MVEMLVNIRADQLRADQGFIYAQCLHLNFITVTRSLKVQHKLTRVLPFYIGITLHFLGRKISEIF